MKNSIKIPKIYQPTVYLTFGYTFCLIIYSVYIQFFFIEKNWFHSLVSNGFAILSNLIWIGILLVFKNLLNTILKFDKVNLILNCLIIFLSIQIFSLSYLLSGAINLYTTLKNTGDLNAMIPFASNSISSIILLFISNFAIILFSFLLGFRLRKINFFDKNLFIILSYSLIAYSIVNILVSLVVIKMDFLIFLFKAIAVFSAGLILQKICNLNASELYTLFGYKRGNETERPKTKKVFFNTNIKVEPKEDRNLDLKRSYVNREDFSNINYDQHEHKDFVIRYYDNLSDEELSLLKNKVLDKQNLIEQEKQNLILQYIFENKLYDSLRFMPNK